MSNKNTYNEKVLIPLLRKGDEKAFEVLYNRYWEKLLTVGYNRTGSIETAKELLQDVFTNLWRRREHLHINTTFAAYIFSAMKYSILDHIRSKTVKEKYVEAIKKTALETNNSTIDSIAFGELSSILEKEIHKLPEKCQVVFRLSRLEHFSNKEIAKELQVSPKTVENHITKALKILRANMQEFTPLIALLFTFPA